MYDKEGKSKEAHAEFKKAIMILERETVGDGEEREATTLLLDARQQAREIEQKFGGSGFLTTPQLRSNTVSAKQL